MDKLNILHIVYAKVWGGGEECAYLMCKELNEQGHNVYVILNTQNSFFREKFSQVANVYLISFSQCFNFKAIWQMKKIIKSHKIDIVHTHSGKVIPMIALLKIFSMDFLFMPFRHNLLKNKNDIFHQWLYDKIDAFLCVSKAVYEIQANSLPEKWRNKVRLIYNGIDTSKYDIGLKNIARFSKKITIGFAGRIHENKGIALLIEAVSEINNSNFQIELKIVGDYENSYGHYLIKTVRENNIENIVSFDGFQKNMSEFYQKIDIFILPSIVKEAFGMVLCEAMYFGKPVISTDSGAQKEIIMDRASGLIIKANSKSEIKKAIEFFLENPQAMKDFGRRGREIVELNFTMKRWGKIMKSIYCDFLKKKR